MGLFWISFSDSLREKGFLVKESSQERNRDEPNVFFLAGNLNDSKI